MSIPTRERRVLLIVPFCKIALCRNCEDVILVDAFFPQFLERSYRIAFLVFSYNDVKSTAVDNKLRKIRLRAMECSGVVEMLSNAYLDAKSFALKSARNLYYFNLLRLVGPIIMSKFLREALRLREDELREVGRAISILDTVFKKCKDFSELAPTSVDEVRIAVSSRGKEVKFVNGPKAVLENYNYLLRVDRGFKKAITRLLEIT